LRSIQQCKSCSCSVSVGVAVPMMTSRVCATVVLQLSSVRRWIERIEFYYRQQFQIPQIHADLRMRDTTLYKILLSQTTSYGLVCGFLGITIPTSSYWCQSRSCIMLVVVAGGMTTWCHHEPSLRASYRPLVSVIRSGVASYIRINLLIAIPGPYGVHKYTLMSADNVHPSLTSFLTAGRSSTLHHW
jgi:hypothetical protein